MHLYRREFVHGAVDDSQQGGVHVGSLKREGLKFFCAMNGCFWIRLVVRLGRFRKTARPWRCCCWRSRGSRLNHISDSPRSGFGARVFLWDDNAGRYLSHLMQ